MALIVLPMVYCTVLQTSASLSSPSDALARHQAGNFFMIYPTIRTLERLLDFADVSAVLGACALSEEPLWTSCPRTGLLSGREARYMEHEAAFGELALVCPDGQIAHPLDWQTERAVPLLNNVMRLTAPNPGVMTSESTPPPFQTLSGVIYF